MVENAGRPPGGTPCTLCRHQRRCDVLTFLPSESRDSPWLSMPMIFTRPPIRDDNVLRAFSVFIYLMYSFLSL